MNIKLKLYFLEKKKEMRSSWFKLMKPLANYLSKREESNYLKMKERITEDQAIKWTADKIIDEVIRHPKYPFRLCIATWQDEEYYNDSYCMGNYSFRRILKKKKYRTAFDKFNNGIEFQEKVVKYLKFKRGITVTEKIDVFKYGKPKDYKKTYIISIGK